jgi:nucleoside-diphosphate-sugar epimerase
MKVLITGTNSGLGQFLHSKIESDSYTRQTSLDDLMNIKYDVVIHCAFNCKNNITQGNLYNYINDNILLTDRIVNKIQSEKIVFISSVDVYPENTPKEENISINIDDVRNIYGKCKLISEEIIKTKNNYLILRPSSILGVNKISKNIHNLKNNIPLTLTKNSKLNYIDQELIYKIISEYIQNDIGKNETINISSHTAVYIDELEKYFSNIQYGNYYYNVGDIHVKKIQSIFPNIKINSSIDYLFKYVNL